MYAFSPCKGLVESFRGFKSSQHTVVTKICEVLNILPEKVIIAELDNFDETFNK